VDEHTTSVDANLSASGRLRRRTLLCAMAGVLLLGGCGTTEPGSARIYFKTDAPFCGRMVIEKKIDGAVLGRDTVASGQLSSPYSVTPGQHVLGASAVFFSGPIPWADTTVNVSAGDSVTRVLPFYCS
jgi:hypothetical protein